MGVISDPPPIPVSPTSAPINRPVIVSCQVTAQRYASIRTSATSGRENSTGGSSPAWSS
jgi:hypothetical protein